MKLARITRRLPLRLTKAAGSPLREVPKVRSTPEHAGPRVVGCSGKTLRRLFNDDPTSVPYVYQAGVRLWVSTPKLHAAIHGADTPWTTCQGCFALGVEKRP